MTRRLAIFKPSSLDNYELCHPLSSDDFENINLTVNGVPRQSTWEPVAMKIVHEDQGEVLNESDSPWLGSHALIFRSRAIHALAPLLRQHGELLPLLCAEAELLLYNCTRVLDALDENISSVVRFRDGRFMGVKAYAFHADVIGETPIFKIPNYRVSPTFVSQRFVELWTSAGLRGLEFEKVWEVH